VLGLQADREIAGQRKRPEDIGHTDSVDTGLRGIRAF
jgi:hypothetical protein